MPLWLVKYMPHFLLVLAIVGGFFFIKHQWHEYKQSLIQQGYNKAISDIKTEQEKANQEIRLRKRAIKHETQSLDRTAIINELCSRGELRTPEYCPN